MTDDEIIMAGLDPLRRHELGFHVEAGVDVTEDLRMSRQGSGCGVSFVAKANTEECPTINGLSVTTLRAMLAAARTDEMRKRAR